MQRYKLAAPVTRHGAAPVHYRCAYDYQVLRGKASHHAISRGVSHGRKGVTRARRTRALRVVEEYLVVVQRDPDPEKEFDPTSMVLGKTVAEIRGIAGGAIDRTVLWC